MGDYSSFVIGAYAVAITVLGGAVFLWKIRLARAKKMLAKMENFGESSQ